VRAAVVKVTVVAPVHNEERNVEPLYREITAVMARSGDAYEIVFVNDGSTDGTAAVLERLAEADPRFHYLDLEFNAGENWALLAGVSRARGEIIVTIDGDGQNDPADIPRLLEELCRGFRVVSGRRIHRAEPFWTRRLPSLVGNALIRWVSGVPVHDCGCGLKAYRREVLEGKFVPAGFMNRFSPVIFGVRASEFSEIAIADRARRSGGSHYGLRRAFAVARDLWALPFALRGAEKWRRRFVALSALLLLALAGFLAAARWYGAALCAAGALLTLGSARNLARFREAKRRPRFRVKRCR
jgi:glycosyltransferase involved in cell wall biosynthesis